MKVLDLKRALLDLWVARAENVDVYADAHGGIWEGNRTYCPSSDWARGGPIIEREKIALFFDDHDDTWSCWLAHLDERPTIAGRTALIAAMRAYVASKFGDEVPDQGGE